MFRNYFKIAYRQLLKNKLFSIVNITGLSVGLASVMVLAIMVYQYLTTDNYQKDIAQMYYLKTASSNGNEYAATPYPLLGEIVKQCPEVEAATHIQQWYYPWLKYGDKEFQETTTFVDTGYFKVFQYPFKYGNAATALKEKFSIVLSEEMALKFFGNINPVGRIFTADDTLQLTVTGVLQHVPANTTIRPDVLLPAAILEANPDFKNGANWYNTFASNYIRLKKNSDVKLFDKKITSIIALNYPQDQKKNKVYAVAFSNIIKDAAPIVGVIIKGAIGAGIFILLIILLNLINLNSAGMYARTKEVAIKQMMGGSKKSILTQFFIENGVIVLISILFAWVFFSLLLLPAVNNIATDNFRAIETGISKNYPLVILLAVVGTLFTILAACLPALKLFTINVTDAVKGKITSGNYKSSYVRNTFITLQFVFAITLIGITIVLNSQVRFMKTSPLGFNQEDIGVASLNLAFRNEESAMERMKSILNELKNNPYVKSVSVNQNIPTRYWDNYDTFYDPANNKEVNLKQAPADEGFVQVYQIPIIQGKNFDDVRAVSEKNAVLINRSAMNAFGWKDAVGKQLKTKGDDDNQVYTVVGVMEDFHYRDLQSTIEPLLQFYTGPFKSQKYGILSVRTVAGYTDKIMRQLTTAFESIPSRRSFSYELMSDKVDKQYALLDGILKITNYVALLTIFIASMGMFGLISLFAGMRIKEIGIRKVLGSSVIGIVKLLSKDFLLLVVLAGVIATPIAWYIMHNWLQDFAYHISISWWMLLLAGFIAIIIAVATVSFQSIKAAIANPVKSLRTE